MTQPPAGLEVLRDRRRLFWLGLIIVLLASFVGVNSQYPALVNEYVLNGDVPQHIYWMQQFRDEDLFRNDLLTEFAKTMQPYGLIVLYRLTSLVWDPLWTSKILPIVLLVLSALYAFRLVHYIGGELSGIFAALLVVTMPMFMGTMAGGTARAFAFPLVFAFLYDLIRADHIKTASVLILQSLFYPIVFFVSLLTYLLTFLSVRDYRAPLAGQRLKIVCLMAAVMLGGTALGAKYLVSREGSLATTVVTRTDMSGRAEFSEKGRFKIIPTVSLTEAMVRTATRPFIRFIADTPLYLAIREKIKPAFVTPGRVSLIMLLLMVPFGWFLLGQVRAGHLRIPMELLYLSVAGVAMYVAANLVLFKLYVPGRYLLHSMPVVALILLSLTMTRLVAFIKPRTPRTAVIGGLIIVLLAQYNTTRGIGLTDKSEHRELYNYLSRLPKNVLIAAHPVLADYVPTFSRRKVLVNYELSHPWSKEYWRILEARTQDLFHAYYASDLTTVSELCKKHGIDYLVVDRRHFSPEYLAAGKIHFEPFDTAVRNYAQKQRQFALLAIREEQKLFVDGDIFVVGVEVLKPS